MGSRWMETGKKLLVMAGLAAGAAGAPRTVAAEPGQPIHEVGPQQKKEQRYSVVEATLDPTMGMSGEAKIFTDVNNDYGMNVTDKTTIYIKSGGGTVTDSSGNRYREVIAFVDSHGKLVPVTDYKGEAAVGWLAADTVTIGSGAPTEIVVSGDRASMVDASMQPGWQGGPPQAK